MDVALRKSLVGEWLEGRGALRVDGRTGERRDWKERGGHAVGRECSLKNKVKVWWGEDTR